MIEVSPPVHKKFLREDLMLGVYNFMLFLATFKISFSFSVDNNILELLQFFL